MGVSAVWNVVRTAATKVPWGKVLENAPAVADLVGLAKGRKQPAPHALEEHLRSLHEENLRLTRKLAEASQTIQELTKAMEVVSARQKMVTVVSVVSLLAALGSLALWYLR